MPVCTHCQCESAYPLISFGEEMLCEACYESYTATCDNCGERVWLHRTVCDNETTLCEECYREGYVTCDECGRIIRASEVVFEDDDVYCQSCDEERRNEEIHLYNYKPKPVFFGEGSRYFGVELEVDRGGEDTDAAEQFLTITGKRMYIKHDGSLNEGFELVTHPMTLSYHRREFPWEELTREAVRLGYRSHQTSTCGLHIHVNRDSLGDTIQQQEEVIARILYFFEEHWNELVRFSRRRPEQLSRWASRYGRKDDPKELMDKAKHTFDRYTGVNLTNHETVEFRIFRGTLRCQTILAALQLVNEICRTALVFSDEELPEMSWSGFVLFLSSLSYAELINQLLCCRKICRHWTLKRITKEKT